ncbi:MAG: hypothetical protein ACU843_18940 [Gammaproteobacteria bacterium]
MAHSPEQWQKAKALFERGITLEEIARQTGISHRGTISKKAKKEKWKGGEMQQLVQKEIDGTYQNLNAASSTVSSAQDSVLGKKPDILINQQTAVAVPQMAEERYTNIAKELLAEVLPLRT